MDNLNFTNLASLSYFLFSYWSKLLLDELSFQRQFVDHFII